MSVVRHRMICLVLVEIAIYEGTQDERTTVKSPLSLLKAGPLRLKQLTNTLKIRILSETSILYLIRYTSIIIIVGLRL